MLNAKTGNWYENNKQRSRSNNSAIIVRSEITKAEFDKVMTSVKEYGEPGFIFTESTEFTFNPCVEIGKLPQIDGVSGWQGCNLTELNGSMATTKEEFFKMCRAGAILGTLQAGYTSFPFLGEISERIFRREALLGVSITGWMNNPEVLFDEETLREGARIVKAVNKEVAELIGINPAARTTCVKPSGNASVLLMTASGIHGEPAPRYLRIAQMNKESEVAQLLKEKNPYMVEESVWSENGTDFAIAFPVVAPKSSIYVDKLLGVDLLEKVKFVQRTWIEEGTNPELCIDPRLRHNVSNTVQVEPDKWEEVADYVYENRQYFAGISFLSTSGFRDYEQAPFTTVFSEQEILDNYGLGALFGGGLVVEALRVFPTLWNAISTARDPANSFQERLDTQQEWIRKFRKFAKNYFEGDDRKAEYCLKDLYVLHRYTKIEQNYQTIDFATELESKKYTEVDTIGAIACAGGACDIF